MDPHPVAIVLDADFGERLVALSRRMHVWTVGSLQNQSMIARVWSERPGYSTTSGVTAMQCDGYSGAMELFSETLVAVDEHHAAPPWSELHIYGMAPNAEVLTLLAGYGATLIVPHDGFFTASREPSFSA